MSSGLNTRLGAQLRRARLDADLTLESSLLDYLVGGGSTYLTVRDIGVQSEMELAYAGLHQLLAPVLHHLDALPVPQQKALRGANYPQSAAVIAATTTRASRLR